MPRRGYFIAIATAIVSAAVFPWPAGADHVAGQEPYFTCRASVARATLLNANPIPTIEPLAANENREECAQDTAGAPTIALPPPPAPDPAVTAGVVQASTELLCATDDPDPAVSPANNDECDAGRRSFEQQLLSRADAADVDVNPAPGLRIQAQAANTTARAQCGPGGGPVLRTTSNVVNLVVTVGGQPFPIQLPPPNVEQEYDLGVAKLTLNELVGTEGAYPNTAPSGIVTRRAIHLEVPGGVEPALGSVADVVVAESIADFHGDVCTVRPSTGPNVRCPLGTVFDPASFACIASARGGTLLPLTPQLRALFRGSPCIGRGFGPLFVIVGTNGPDRITGTNRSDRIFALGGSDRVSGGRGDDCVEGGSGRDVIDGSNGNDFLLGGTGNDQVSGGPGRDRFSGGAGRDVLSGGGGPDRMEGGSGRDRLNGGYGSDRLVGGAGNDGIHTGNGRDRVFAGAGNDVINAATRGPAAFVDCGSGRSDRVRINRNEIRRTRNCEFVDVFRRVKSNNRQIRPR